MELKWTLEKGGLDVVRNHAKDYLVLDSKCCVIKSILKSLKPILIAYS